MIAIPYELIGKVVVGFVGGILAGVSAYAILFAIAFIWVRGWAALSELMWRGHDPHEEEWPPLWKSRISGVAICLSRLKFRKIPAVYREATERSIDK